MPTTETDDNFMDELSSLQKRLREEAAEREEPEIKYSSFREALQSTMNKNQFPQPNGRRR